MTWTSLSFAFGSVLTSAKQTQLYNNITAQANGDSGAPKQQTAGIANSAVTSAKIAANVVGNNDLRQIAGSTGTQAIAASTIWVPSAGWYNFSSDSANDWYFETKVSSTWYGNASSSPGTVFCDGTNMRIRASSGGATTMAWQKLSN